MSNHTIKNRYTKIGDPIAIGAFGKVFKGKDKFDDKTVAIKEIDTCGIDAEEAFRISQEATTLASLNHENIIKYHDSCNENQTFYIITEYCDKRSLFHAIIQPKQISSEDKVKIWLTQSLDALKYIHQRNIYHRDIKPLNIFISNDNMKIGDFGISITASGTMYALSLFGSELYRAPEILRRETYDSKSDIWALGATFYELCSFETPYRSEADIVNNTSINKIDNYSITLNEILKKMLSNQPSNRLSAADILELYFQKGAEPEYQKHENLAAKNQNDNIERINNEKEKKFEIPEEFSRFTKHRNMYKINSKNLHKLILKPNEEWKQRIKNNLSKFFTEKNLNDLFINLDENKIPNVFFKNINFNEQIVSKYRGTYTGGHLHYFFTDHTDFGGIIVWFHENSHIESQYLVYPGFFLFCKWGDFSNVFPEE